MSTREHPEQPPLVEASAVIDRLADLEMENRKLQDRMADLEQRHLGLAQLLAASLRLHRAADRESLMDAILEIAINVVGSEQLGLYLRGESGKLMLVRNVGDDALAHPRFDPGGAIARAAETGKVQRADAASPLAAPTACVPLRTGKGAAGVLAIFRLLPQKPALDAKDESLLELLADQAGPLLQAASGSHRSS